MDVEEGRTHELRLMIFLILINTLIENAPELV